MIAVEIAPQSLADLLELQRRNAEALRATTPGESGFDDLIADATLQLRDAAAAVAPLVTGALSAAHRGVLSAVGTGQVFVDPAARNPVSGGQPAVYGQAVHQRKPWLGQAVQLDGPRILGEVGQKLFARLDQVYQGAG